MIVIYKAHVEGTSTNFRPHWTGLILVRGLLNDIDRFRCLGPQCLTSHFSIHRLQVYALDSIPRLQVYALDSEMYVMHGRHPL